MIVFSELTVTAGGGYTFTAHLAAAASRSVAFCLSELEQTPTAGKLPDPVYDPAPTSAHINRWLADAIMSTAHALLGSSANANTSTGKWSAVTGVRQYYRSWFQFWYNTEHPASRTQIHTKPKRRNICI